MANFRLKNRLVWAKVETTAGTDAVPTQTEAVFIENPRWPPNLQTVQTNEVSGSLDSPAATPAGGWRNFTGRVYMKGAGTAGNAVDFGALLRGSTMGTRQVAAAVTGTAQAGAAGSITLASGASSTTDLYKGMMITTTGGTGSGQTRIATAYNGTTKVLSVLPNWTVTPDNTTTYSIPAQYGYRPQSATLENITIYGYEKNSTGGNARLNRLLGAAGNARFQLQVGQACAIDFTYQGTLTGGTDPADPGVPTYSNQSRLPFINANVYVGQERTSVNDFTLDLGNRVVMEPNPNQEFGYEVAGVVDRRINGTMSLAAQNFSVRDPFTSWKNNTSYQMGAWWGSTAGNRVAVLLDGLVYSNIDEGDVEGYTYDNLQFGVQAPDSSFFLTFW
ncbi:MAG: hypothetical protein K0R61_2375 [Microvirga sp.]|jgi:hypothetical protein|nr:hypothetical protein [Microvirga sp.]